MFSGEYISGMAIGVGIGWLNVNTLALPGWANILMMAFLAIMGVMMTNMESFGR